MYVDPNKVDSPKGLVRSVNIVHNAGDGGWAVADIDWEGQPRVGIRWNGSEAEAGVGNPQSRGHATWFIVPDPLGDAVRSAAEDAAKQDKSRLADGYRAMARDEDREKGAQDWAEGLIGDAADPKR